MLFRSVGWVEFFVFPFAAHMVVVCTVGEHSVRHQDRMVHERLTSELYVFVLPCVMLGGELCVHKHTVIVPRSTCVLLWLMSRRFRFIYFLLSCYSFVFFLCSFVLCFRRERYDV